MRLFAGMAAGYVALMLVIVFYTLGLRPLPRYFAFATVLATVLVGLWLAEGLLRPRWRWAAAMALVTIVATNLILVDLSDLDPRFGARRLVDAMAAHPNEVIYTDPKLDQQARQLESWAGLDPDRSVPEPPEPGALFLAYGPTATKGYVQGREFDPQDFRTRPSWRQVRRYDREPTLLGSVLVGIVLERANTPLPGRVYQAGPSAILYRLPGSAGAPMRYQAAGRLPATIASMRATASADRTLRQLDVAAAGSRRTP
jgi:hypothetical protein